MLPVRDGVGPSQVALPPGPWVCMLDFLVERFPAIGAQEWIDRMAQGSVVDRAGRRVTPQAPYVPHGKLYYYRAVDHEPVNSAQARVLFEDDLLVVADKPHLLAVTPSGQYLQETLLVRLRRQLGVGQLTPLHRIDRETAGLVMLAKQPSTLPAYHALFAQGRIAKAYQAIAPLNPGLQFPMSRRSTLVPGDHFMRMREAPDAAGQVANAHTEIELMQVRGDLARFRLRPITGKRHQLRVHMASLGMPLVGDRIYPRLLPAGNDEMDNPLRLLAESLAFLDPITGKPRLFSSRQQLHFPTASRA